MNISYLDTSTDPSEERVMRVGVEVGMEASRRDGWVYKLCKSTLKRLIGDKSDVGQADMNRAQGAMLI